MSFKLLMLSDVPIIGMLQHLRFEGLEVEKLRHEKIQTSTNSSTVMLQK